MALPTNDENDDFDDDEMTNDVTEIEIHYFSYDAHLGEMTKTGVRETCLFRIQTNTRVTFPARIPRILEYKNKKEGYF